MEKNTEILEVIENCNRDFFPNIHRLLRILATIPITTTTPERSFSTMKRVKTWSRNKMGNERLSSLALLSINWELQVMF
nr:unnamed protein product [Callosobruchus chinensis]